MELNKFWALQENWKAFFQEYDLQRAVYEAFDIWYDLVNQDNEADVVSHLARLEAANFQMISKYNELPENGRREFLNVSVGPTELPVFETIRNFILNLSHWVNIDGTTRKEIFDKLNEVGFPCKPLEVDALKRAFVKANQKKEDWREHDLNYVMKMFDKSKNTIPRWADDTKRPYIRRSNREGYYLLNYSDPFIIGAVTTV